MSQRPESGVKEVFASSRPAKDEQTPRLISFESMRDEDPWLGMSRAIRWGLSNSTCFFDRLPTRGSDLAAMVADIDAVKKRQVGNGWAGRNLGPAFHAFLVLMCSCCLRNLLMTVSVAALIASRWAEKPATVHAYIGISIPLRFRFGAILKKSSVGQLFSSSST